MFFLQIDPDKCVGCDTCMGYCPTGAIYGDLGQPHKISYEAPCIRCGQCLTHCPEMAIYEKQTWVPELQEKLHDPSVKCIAMPAPAVRYALGEAFGLRQRHNGENAVCPQGAWFRTLLGYRVRG